MRLRADLCRKHGMSDATFYNWKAKYALTVSELKRLKSLEDENRRLKQIVAHQRWTTGRSRSCCQKTSKAQGEENSGVIRHGGSWAEERRACQLTGESSSVYPRSGVMMMNSARCVVGWGKEAVWQSQAAHHAQEGGIGVNHKRTERIYREEGLGLRRKRRRKGTAGARVIIPVPNVLTRSGPWISLVTALSRGDASDDDRGCRGSVPPLRWIPPWARQSSRRPDGESCLK